jgi:hypothetical protein
MINTDAAIALVATAAGLPALCTFFLPSPPRHAASPIGRLHKPTRSLFAPPPASND